MQGEGRGENALLLLRDEDDDDEMNLIPPSFDFEGLSLKQRSGKKSTLRLQDDVNDDDGMKPSIVDRDDHGEEEEEAGENDDEDDDDDEDNDEVGLRLGVADAPLTGGLKDDEDDDDEDTDICLFRAYSLPATASTNSCEHDDDGMMTSEGK